MKKYLKQLLVVMAAMVVLAGGALASQDSHDAVVVSLDNQGQSVVTSLDGAGDILLEYGDPDSGIAGNRGESTGSSANAIGDIKEIRVPEMLMLLFVETLQRWQIVLR